MKYLIYRFPKTASVIAATAVAAASYYGGPLAAEAARELLATIFG